MTLLSGVVFYLIKKIEMFVSQVEAMEIFSLAIFYTFQNIFDSMN